MVKNILKELRQLEGYSQEEICERLGISRPLYSEMEKGAKSLTVKQARILADLYDV